MNGFHLADEPDHQELCNREQRYFLKAITEDMDLTNHMDDAVNSLRIAFACDESVRRDKWLSCEFFMYEPALCASAVASHTCAVRLFQLKMIIILKELFIIIWLVLLVSCNQRIKNNAGNTLPLSAKFVEIKLADSLGNVSMYIPNRYDTFFRWTHYSDCGKSCDETEKYRYQPKTSIINNENGLSLAMCYDSIERFTIFHSSYAPFFIGDKSEVEGLNMRTKNYFRELHPDKNIRFDTIEGKISIDLFYYFS